MNCESGYMHSPKSIRLIGLVPLLFLPLFCALARCAVDENAFDREQLIGAYDHLTTAEIDKKSNTVLAVNDTSITVLDGRTLKPKRRPILLPHVVCSKLSPDGRLLAAATDDGLITIFEVTSDVHHLKLSEVVGARVRWLEFSDDSSKLLAVAPSMVLSWKMRPMKRLTPVIESPNWNVGFFSKAWFIGDGSRVVTLQANGYPAILWNSANGKQLRVLSARDQLNGGVWAACISKDESRFVTGEVYNVDHQDCYGCGVWDLSSEKLLFRIGPLPHQISAVSLSADGKLLAVAAGAVSIFDAKSGILLFHPFGGPLGRLHCVEFSCDGSCVFVGGEQREAFVWDIRSNQVLLYAGIDTATWQGAFSADGRHLLTSCGSGVFLWSIEQVERRATRE